MCFYRLWAGVWTSLDTHVMSLALSTVPSVTREQAFRSLLLQNLALNPGSVSVTNGCSVSDRRLMVGLSQQCGVQTSALAREWVPVWGTHVEETRDSACQRKATDSAYVVLLSIIS